MRSPRPCSGQHNRERAVRTRALSDKDIDELEAARRDRHRPGHARQRGKDVG